MINLLNKLLNDYNVRFWIREINPLWSRVGYKAKIIDIKQESKNVKTFTMQVKGWKGFKAGQYINVCVEVNGVRMRRCYSLTSNPKDTNKISITVKKSGKVSNWMCEKLAVGDTLEFNDAIGEFTLDDVNIDDKLLFVMGGSGITPGISILKEINYNHDIVFIQACKSNEDILFKSGSRCRRTRVSNIPGNTRCEILDTRS